MFGMQQYGVTPDIASFAKGITSGYIPLGGVGVSDEIFDVMSDAGPHVHARLHLLRPPGRLRRRPAQHPHHRGGAFPENAGAPAPICSTRCTTGSTTIPTSATSAARA